MTLYYPYCKIKKKKFYEPPQNRMFLTLTNITSKKDFRYSTFWRHFISVHELFMRLSKRQRGHFLRDIL